jgi:hypothetical protein
MSNRRIYAKKSPLKKYLSIVIFLLIGAAVGFIYLSPMFEKNKPTIVFQDKQFWNLKSPLILELSDDTGLEHYSVVYQANGQDIILNTKVLQKDKKTAKIRIYPPELNQFNKQAHGKLKIEVNDISKWNFLSGNMTSKTYDIYIDTTPPIAQVLTNTYAIRRGGSAVVVVKVKDINLKKAYISFNNKLKFKLTPFEKEDYYAAIIGWDVNIKEFKRVNLVAIDEANNISKVKVPLYTRKLQNKKSTLKVSDNFINKACKTVLKHMKEKIPDDQVETFIKVNKEVRAQNVAFIRELGLTKFSYNMVDSFNIKPFKRLNGSRQVGNYADERDYTYDGKKIDHAWHLGIDWASIKHAKIFSSNAGEVVFKDYLGIYGNAIVIDHGLGLGSLFAHTSSSDVELGQKVKAGRKIANTGATGAVFGDHLHFGIIVQGIEVNPKEWMDKQWIKTRITDVLDDAKEIINK